MQAAHSTLCPLFVLFFFSKIVQVTEGKQDLEKALSLSQKFHKESTALQEWLTTSDAQLQQKNSSGDMPADIDAEIGWANVSKLEKKNHQMCRCTGKNRECASGQQVAA